MATLRELSVACPNLITGGAHSRIVGELMEALVKL
jgi:hypothetical protein